jgi:tetratricopeptide (TPR) repeat protein
MERFFMTTISSVAGLIKAGAVVTTLTFAGAGVLPAFADGGGGGGGGKPPVNCNEGWTYNKQKGVCEQTSLLDDGTLTEQGRALALNGYYEGALEALMAVRNKNDATVLTYIGYATRKLGQVDEGIAWYHKALAVDPGNVHTREYLGEGYVAAGRLDLAKQELAKLEALCGKGCEQYEALSAAIAGEPEQWGGSS